MKPPFPWNGAKTRLLKQLEPYIRAWGAPPGTRWIEPFLGSGVVSRYVRSLFPETLQVVGDSNPWLMAAHRHWLSGLAAPPTMADAFAVLERKDQRVDAVCMSEAQFHQLVWKGVDQMEVRKPEVCCGAWVATLWGAPILLSENVGRRVVLVPDTGKKADCFALGSYIAPEFIYV